MCTPEQLKQIPAYEDLPVITATINIGFKLGTYITNLEALHELFMLTVVNLPERRRKANKINIPFMNNPGAIMFSGFREKYRGIIGNKKKKNFRHAIGVIAAISHKNLFLKISNEGIHVCGSKGIKDGQEIFTRINHHIQYIHQMLNFIQNNQKIARDTMNWVLESMCGQQIYREDYVQWIDSFGNVVTSPVYQLDYKLEYKLVEVKTEINQELAMIFFGYAATMDINEFYYSCFQKKLQFIMSFNQPVCTQLELGEIEVYMLNHNFNLGFMIDREKLNIHMNYREGFFVTYDPERSQVIVEIRSKQVDGEYRKTQSGKMLRHSFTCRSTGNVTQSDKGDDESREAYYHFWKVILDIRHLIELKVTEPKEERKDEFLDFITDGHSDQIDTTNSTDSSTGPLSRFSPGTSEMMIKSIPPIVTTETSFQQYPQYSQYSQYYQEQPSYSGYNNYGYYGYYTNPQQANISSQC